MGRKRDVPTMVMLTPLERARIHELCAAEGGITMRELVGRMIATYKPNPPTIRELVDIADAINRLQLRVAELERARGTASPR